MLIGDPIPIRMGIPYGGGRGILTKREMEKVVEVLKLAKTEQGKHYDPRKDEDTWTAFVSLLRGSFIVERPRDSQKYVLTEKGKLYLSQLTS